MSFNSRKSELAFTVVLCACISACGAKPDTGPVGPEPFITNYGRCFSRTKSPAQWTPHQQLRDIGTFGWSAAWWDFGFLTPVETVGIENGPDDLEQNNIYIELIELNPSTPPPTNALGLIYDRGYLRTPEVSIPQGFSIYRANGYMDFLLVSDDGRIAAECTEEPKRWPNPRCDVKILGPGRGVWLFVSMPHRGLTRLESVARQIEASVATLEVPCAEDAKPTFRYEPGRVYLPPASSAPEPNSSRPSLPP